MPPKTDPKKVEHKDPPKLPKKFETEDDYQLWASKLMESEDFQKVTIIVKADGKDAKAPAKGKVDKGGEVKIDPKEQQFKKEDCFKFIEHCIDTYLVEKQIEEIWDKITRVKDKDGKKLEVVWRLDLEAFTLQRTYDLNCIKKTRLGHFTETVNSPIEKYELTLLDFN